MNNPRLELSCYAPLTPHESPEPQEYGYIIFDDVVDDESHSLDNPIECIMEAQERAKVIAVEACMILHFDMGEALEPHSVRVALVHEFIGGGRDHTDLIQITYDPKTKTFEKKHL